MTVTIADVYMEDFDGDNGSREHKPCIRFTQGTKHLLLNKTNSTMLADAFGDETDSWCGRQVILFGIKTDFRGKIVDAIRVRPAAASQPQQQPPAQAPPAQQPSGTFDQTAEAAAPGGDGDEIPF